MNDIGVIAIGRNEGERLRKCLASVVGGGFTIVYVDSNSSDGSVELARSLGCEVVQLDLSIPFSAARARNEGLARLLAINPGVKHVQMVDGDCEIVPGWIERAADELNARPKAAVVCGRRRERFPQASIYNALADVEWDSPIGEVQSCGGDAFMRVEAIQGVGAYDVTVVAGEEPEMCQRLREKGWTIHRIDAEMTLHDSAMIHFRQWWRRQIRSGYGAMDVATRFGGKGLFVAATKSARRWALGYPSVVALAAVISFACFDWKIALGLTVGTIAVLPLQMIRVAFMKRACGLRIALSYGVLTMLGKWAFYQGQRQYWNDRAAGKLTRDIDYKMSAAPPPMSDFAADLARYPRRPFLKEQSIWALAWYRVGRRIDARPDGVIKTVGNAIYWPLHRVIETITGVSLPKGATIGPGLRIHHFGSIFVHSNAILGANCTLRQGVTIGVRIDGGPAPVLEDDVDCGAYAQILGGIRIGKGAKIGAMSVVLIDVHAGATAVGVPARILQPKLTDTIEQAEPVESVRSRE